MKVSLGSEGSDSHLCRCHLDQRDQTHTYAGVTWIRGIRLTLMQVSLGSEGSDSHLCRCHLCRCHLEQKERTHTYVGVTYAGVNWDRGNTLTLMPTA